MSRIYPNELAAILATRHKCDRTDTMRFLNAVVRVIKEGLQADRVVKVKGLGTFKVVEVDARESVNVNTGEKVVIDSHQRLVFLPDNMMKELVNKPFSMFETVVLNDGVDFSDVDGEDSPAAEDFMVEFADEENTDEENTVSEASTEVETEEPEEPESPEELEEPEEPENPESPESPEELESLEGPEELESLEGPEEPENPEIPEIPEEPESPDEPEEPENWEEKPHHSKWWLWLLLATVVGGTVFAVYMLTKGSKDGTPAASNTDMEVQKAVKTDTTTQAQTDSATLVQTDTTTQVHTDTTSMEKVKAELADTGEEHDWMYYDTIDARLRTGAYAIVGYDHSIRARQDDDTRRIAMREAGSEQMSCYIEVFNGITASTLLESGREIRIPKLVTKKKLRMEQQQNNN